MKHSPEYDEFKKDAEKIAKAGLDITKSGAKLWRKLTKQWGREISKLSEKAYSNLRERRAALKKETKKKLIIALAAASTTGGAGILYTTQTPEKEKNTPKTEQLQNTTEKQHEQINEKEVASYKQLSSKKFWTKLLKTKPSGIQLVEKKEKKDKLILHNFPKDNEVAGRVMRCLRRKALTDEAEKKYGIPQNLLLAMMAQEGLWDPTLPNIMNWKTDEKTGKKKITKSDWGLGLIHIQGANAEDYGLKVIQTKPWEKNSRAMQDTILWKKILSLYEQTQDTNKLAKYDDRWNPVLAVDVAARFLRDMYERYGADKGKDAWIYALNRYSWRKRTDYATKVISYWTLLDQYEYGEKSQIPDFSKEVNDVVKKYTADTSRITTLKNKVDSVSIELNGTPWWFKKYLEYFTNELNQYWFEAYKKHNPTPQNQ